MVNVKIQLYKIMDKMMKAGPMFLFLEHADRNDHIDLDSCPYVG